MALHPKFSKSPYESLIPEQRWFPADEALRNTAYEKLIPPLVAKVRREVYEWRNEGYPGASATSVSLLRWWFEKEHLIEDRIRLREMRPFRTRKDRELELTTASHTYDKPGRYTVAVKVIDIFGNDTMTLIPITAG
jgi:hypothetical protein